MITEAQRHRLYIALEGEIGEEANTLMDLLPASGWADVATKRDLEKLATKDALHELRGELHRELHDVQRTMIFAMIGAMVAQTGLVVTLVVNLVH